MAGNLMLANDPVYAFTPTYDRDQPVQQILMVFEGMTGHASTSLVALSLQDAEQLCDRLNAQLGLDRDAWLRIAAQATPSVRPNETRPQ